VLNYRRGHITLNFITLIETFAMQRVFNEMQGNKGPEFMDAERQLQ